MAIRPSLSRGILEKSRALITTSFGFFLATERIWHSMAETASFIPQITLDLSNSHFIVDFTSPDRNIKATVLPTTSDRKLTCKEGVHHNGKCKAADGVCDAALLISEQNECTAREGFYPVAKHRPLKWPWQHSHHECSNTPSRNFLCKSMSSTTSSTVSSIPNLSTCATSTTSSTPRSLSPWSDPPTSSLLSLPHTILSQIFGHILSVPSILPIGHNFCYSIQTPSHPSRITLGQALKLPLFLVSHSIRDLALDVFFSKNIFIIDLAAIYDSAASRVDLQIKQLQKFWISDTPVMVKASLQRIARLILRIPVPSTEAAVRRGREERHWMDGSDGHGGGEYRLKSLKEEVDDALVIQKCLRSIVRMTHALGQKEKAPSRSSSRLGRPRRSKSLKRARPEREANTTANDLEHNDRKALRLLEVILVKRSSRAMVLQEVLGQLHILKHIPVRGILRICFELNGRKTFWATKRKEVWEDRISDTEPDGAKLLHDLQSLRTWRQPDIEPITSPTEFKYVSLNKEGMLFISPTALRHSHLGADDAHTLETPRPRTGFQVQKQRIDSFAFIMAQGIEYSERTAMLQKEEFWKDVGGGVDVAVRSGVGG